MQQNFMLSEKFLNDLAYQMKNIIAHQLAELDSQFVYSEVENGIGFDDGVNRLTIQIRMERRDRTE